MEPSGNNGRTLVPRVSQKRFSGFPSPFLVFRLIPVEPSGNNVSKQFPSGFPSPFLVFRLFPVEPSGNNVSRTFPSASQCLPGGGTSFPGSPRGVSLDSQAQPNVSQEVFPFPGSPRSISLDSQAQPNVSQEVFPGFPTANKQTHTNKNTHTHTPNKHKETKRKNTKNSREPGAKRAVTDKK